MSSKSFISFNPLIQRATHVGHRNFQTNDAPTLFADAVVQFWTFLAKGKSFLLYGFRSRGGVFD